MLLAGIVVLFLLGGGALAYYLLVGKGPTAVTTPTPTPTVTEGPSASNLASIFAAQAVDIELSEAIDLKADYAAKLGSLILERGTIRKLDITLPEKGSTELTVLDLLDKFGALYPPELRTAAGLDAITLAYGQAPGTQEGALVLNRVVFVLELADPATAQQALSQWQSMVKDFSPLMGYAIPSPEPALTDGIYGSTSLSFVQLPDRNTGLAVATVGKYLIFASSKDSFELAVDRLLSQQ